MFQCAVPASWERNDESNQTLTLDLICASSLFLLLRRARLSLWGSFPFLLFHHSLKERGFNLKRGEGNHRWPANMYSWSLRLNTVLTLGVTVLAALCAVASFTDTLHRSTPYVDLQACSPFPPVTSCCWFLMRDCVGIGFIFLFVFLPSILFPVLVARFGAIL